MTEWTLKKTFHSLLKKKVKFDDVWNTSNLVFLSEVAEIQKGKTITEAKAIKGNIPVIAGGQSPAYFHNESNRDRNIITVSASGAYAGFINYFDIPIFASDCNTIKSRDEKIISTKLIFHFLKSIQKEVYKLQRGQAQPHVYADDLLKVKIPLLPFDIQKKIVSEIEAIENQEQKANETILELRKEIKNKIGTVQGESKKLRQLCKYSDKRISSSLLTSKNYIGVDNMLQNMAGKIDSNFVPDSGTSTEYNVGNILLSNIRPYLRKIWFADENGGSSNDVLVLQKTIESIEAKFIYYSLKQDDFFDYVMQKPKGLKMPRGDKQHIMDFKITLPSLPEQQKIIVQLDTIENRIADLEKQIDLMPKQKEKILRKYLN